LSPILSGIADYTGTKKNDFFAVFFATWVLSVLSYYFFKGQDTLWIGILGTIFASVGFWEVSFYNSYLPEIAHQSSTIELVQKVSCLILGIITLIRI
jgi:UMF1 family MFS transporter